jgi:hypothetical protein
MSPLRTGQPAFSDLSRDECDALLARHHVGRLAFTFRDRVDIEPIHYVFRDGRIFFRTAPGSKLAMLMRHPWVAFEVDEVAGMFDWQSVVVHGTVYTLKPEGTDAEKAAYRDAVRALRRVVPETLRAADPVPFRDIVVELAIDRVTGRSARES